MVRNVRNQRRNGQKNLGLAKDKDYPQKVGEN